MSLISLNAAVIICWIAYHQYQPKILLKYNFQDLHTFLIIAQAIILVTIPTLAGYIGDKMAKDGKQFIVFTVGISLTAIVFMIVAGGLNIAPASSLKYVIPVMIVIWLVSMNIFHGPANCLLEKFATAKNLPLAMAVMVCITELIYSLEPIIVYIIEYIGDVLTFVVGGVLIVITGWFYLSANKSKGDAPLHTEETTADTSFIGAIILVGLVVGIATAFIMDVIPDIIPAKLDKYNWVNPQYSGYLSFGILGVSAILSIPMSMVINRIKIVPALILASFLIAFSSLFILFSDNPQLILINAVALAAGYSMCTVAAFPFALKNMNKNHLALLTGVFFGAQELPSGIISIIERTKDVQFLLF